MSNNIKYFFNRYCPTKIHPRHFAARQVEYRAQGRIIAGPFIGMKYIQESVGSAYLPKLLGTYELELHPVIEKLCRKDFTSVIDVGAAEGYYAVGMALKKSGVKVIAFETESHGQELIHSLASLNEVDGRVVIKGTCDVATLGNVLDGEAKPLVIMDVEGAELDLLKPQILPALDRCEILVELHESVSPGLTEEIRARFSSTHHIEEFRQRDRTNRDIPIRSFLKRWILPMTSEWRLTENKLTGELVSRNMSWFYMKPLNTIS